MQIKICGLSRPEDIQFVNEARPEYCGFVINFPKSRRNITVEMLKSLRTGLAPGITPVGVFVNMPVELVAGLLNENILSAAQLHGDEDEAYIIELKSRVRNAAIWKAFRFKNGEPARTLAAAEKSSADLILFDAGQGDGQVFNWSLLEKFHRPFALAGGLAPNNARDAIKFFTEAPLVLLDVSSGVESEPGVKSRDKILAFVRAVRI